jgi:hypothetical protein
LPNFVLSVLHAFVPTHIVVLRKPGTVGG